MSKIKCPKDLNTFILDFPFENTFSPEECEMRQFYGDCYHCFATAIAKRDKAIREQAKNVGVWVLMSHKQFESGNELFEYHCSICRHNEFHAYSDSALSKYCPNCGASMIKEGGDLK